MRTAPLAAGLAVVLCVSALAALAPLGGVPHYSGTPARGHVAFGPVAVLARPEPHAAAATPLAEAARARYGRIDGLARVRTEPLPFGDGAFVTGVAVRWN